MYFIMKPVLSQRDAFRYPGSYRDPDLLVVRCVWIYNHNHGLIEMRIVLLILRWVWRVLTWIFLTYAVLFSVSATVLLIWASSIVLKPINEVKALRTVNPKQSMFMKRYNTNDSTGVCARLQHRFVPLDSISDNLKKAVIAAEDDGFYLHPGIDISAILTAVDYNQRMRKNSRGASTITQQLAKNLFLSGERTFYRKAKELAYTLLMERYLGKDRILELYLNYAQWGKTIFGCEAAAQQYFHTSASRLTMSQASRMAAVLAMPSRLSPTSTSSQYMGKRLTVIANNLYLSHQIGTDGYRELAGTEPPDSNSADSVRANAKGQNAVETDSVVQH
jgi:monofunctional biosynthetic peptidoglycan transglycosylase